MMGWRVDQGGCTPTMGFRFYTVQTLMGVFHRALLEELLKGNGVDDSMQRWIPNQNRMGT